MLDDMLIVAEIENHRLAYSAQTVNIGAFVRDTLEEFRIIERNNHRLVLEEEFSETIESDPKLLRQILNNLLSNAMKYSPQGSSVTLRVTGDSGCCVFSVSDQGAGIPAADLEQIFNAFFRATNVNDSEGTGLGLAIVKEAVIQCGGQVQVDSELGKGTTFVVKLPLRSNA
ncbi:MAG: ATP-binding protein [Caldilineaceae bacterium]